MSSFIDDFEKNRNICKYYIFENVIRSVKSALEDAFTQNTELENDVIISCENSGDEFPEVDEFENSDKRISKFEESLLIPNEQDTADSLFYSICYTVRFFKSDKIDAY